MEKNLGHWHTPTIYLSLLPHFSNFLFYFSQNAIKFTTSGEVYTKCSVQKPVTNDSEIMLLFEVVDTGSGFDADGEAVMFKPFSQVDASVSPPFFFI